MRSHPPRGALTMREMLVAARAFAERQAITGRVLRIVTRMFAPRGPRPMQDGLAERVVPPSRAKATWLSRATTTAASSPTLSSQRSSQRGVEKCPRSSSLMTGRRDDSRDVAARLIERYPEARLLVNDVNSGQYPLVQQGGRRLSGDYVVKLDADDLLTPDFLSRAVALFEAHPHGRTCLRAPASLRVRDSAYGSRCRHLLDRLAWEGLAEGTLPPRRECDHELHGMPPPLGSSSGVGPMNPAVAYAPDMEISLRVAVLSVVRWFLVRRLLALGLPTIIRPFLCVVVIVAGAGAAGWGWMKVTDQLPDLLALLVVGALVGVLHISLSLLFARSAVAEVAAIVAGRRLGARISVLARIGRWR